MRLLKLGVYHPTYLRDFYTNNPSLGTQSYSGQHKALIDDRFGSSDFWTNALAKLGHETTEIIANAEFVQRRWALENGFSFANQDWLFQIAAAQIKDFRPDVLLVADYSTFTGEFLKQVRRDNPSIRLILGWCGAPHDNSPVFREWDIALSCVPELVTEFRAHGLESYHVNHAFDKRVLQKVDLDTVPEIDFAFLGSIVKKDRFHIERERLLLYLLKHTNLQIFSDIPPPVIAVKKSTSAIARLRESVLTRGQNIRRGLVRNGMFSARHAAEQKENLEQNVDVEIADRVLPPVFGVEMFERLRDTRVVFNNHIDISRTHASNMRLFETTGVGSCLLTDSKENLSELFEPDKEVLTYQTAEECAEKVAYILEHETERRSIAAAGQARTLRDHTYDNRALGIDEIIRGALGIGSQS